ncbi:MAG: family 1 glycosylhydrolase [Bifidobacterium breve]|nr:family 1 glycosylhydrolase [Bifidobacterium breve]MCC4093129.1 family 1 glycosylhydrolase [Bifidobacterium breve]
MTTITFPSGFLWGAATAAHQVEGNNIASDLWEKEYAPETTIKEPSGDACDSYNRFEEDIQLLADAELNTYRFSLEWARIEPVQGVISNAQLLHYRRMIEACQNRGVEPFVTLHHFSNPAWFTHNGGWKAGDAVELFLKYVETVKPILKDVNWICTINEPNMVAQDKNVKPGPDPRIPYLPPVDPQVRDTLIEAHQKTRALLSDLQAKTGWSPATITYEALPAPTPMPHHLPRTVWMISSPQQPETITSACKHIKGSSSTRTVQYRRQTDWR